MRGVVTVAAAFLFAVTACSTAHPTTNGNQSPGAAPTVAQGTAASDSPNCHDLDQVEAEYLHSTVAADAAKRGWPESKLRNFFSAVCGSPPFTAVYRQLSNLGVSDANREGQVFASWRVYCNMMYYPDPMTGAITTPDIQAQRIADFSQTSLQQGRAEVDKMLSFGCRWTP
jgi:hypothetical protein